MLNVTEKKWTDEEIQCLHRQTVTDEELSLLLNKPLMTVREKRIEVLGNSIWRSINASR